MSVCLNLDLLAPAIPPIAGAGGMVPLQATALLCQHLLLQSVPFEPG